MVKSTKIIIIIILLILFIWIFDIFKSNKSLEKSLQKTKIKINDKVINAYIVDNPATRSRGLSIFNSIKEDEGMLFLFPEDNKSKKIGIWMLGMKFDIDIIWIKDNKIIRIEKNAPYPRNITIKSYNQNELANVVLEVSAGFTDKNNIKIGDIINY